jgi:hypothetical protein
MDEWGIDAGKHLIIELSKISKSWSDWFVIQKPLFLLPDFLLKFRIRFIKYLKGFYKIKNINENIILFTPKIPFHFKYWLSNRLITWIDLFFLKKQVQNLIRKKFPGQKIILWVYMPKLFPVIKVIKHDYLIYYIQDNLTYDACTGKLISPDNYVNIELIKNSDMILSTSKEMYNYAKVYNNNVVHIPNGNNYSILTLKENMTTPTEIDYVDDPIIGYVGGIRCWIDFELIEYMLENLKNCLFVFIGPLFKNATEDIKCLLKHNNFRWIKFKEQSQLPAYLNKFKVGIIPFKINNFMASVFPNKFYEYMAIGLPIVTTALPELKIYSDLIGYSNSKEEFLSNCKDAIDGKFDKFRDEYRDLAKSNTWESKAGLINKKLLEKLN